MPKKPKNKRFKGTQVQNVIKQDSSVGKPGCSPTQSDTGNAVTPTTIDDPVDDHMYVFSVLFPLQVCGSWQRPTGHMTYDKYLTDSDHLVRVIFSCKNAGK